MPTSDASIGKPRQAAGPPPWERIRRVRTLAALDRDAPWIVLTTTPSQPGLANAPEADALAKWVRTEVAAWPAPILIAREPPLVSDDAVVFSPAQHLDAPGVRYRCEFHSDGSALVALGVGNRRRSSNEASVWAIGEGAVAWITVAALRLAAAYALTLRSESNVWVEAALLEPEDGSVEMWGHDQGAYRLLGTRDSEAANPLAEVDPSCCVSEALVDASRPLVAGILNTFGLVGDRHISPDGALRRSQFTGFDDRIRAWADTIGIPSQP